MWLRNYYLYLFILLLITAICPAEFQVNTYTNDHQEYAAIAMGPQGDFVVVWRSAKQNAGSRGTYGQRFTADGEPIGGEFRINTTSVGGRVSTGPSVAMDNSGNFVVVWTGYRIDEENIIARCYNAGGSPITGEFVVNTSKHSTYENSHIGPSVAMNASGVFVVVWQAWHGNDSHNGNWAVYGRVYESNGVPQADEFMVTQLPHGFYPDVVIDDSGDFVVAWLRSGDSDDLPLGQYVRFRRYSADGTPKEDAVQITEDLGATDLPSIGMDGSGNFAITWNYHPQSYKETDVYTQLFGPNGNFLSEPSMVNSYTDGRQGQEVVSMDEDGRFVIAWISENEDGSDYGIFGQKYNSDGTRIGGEFQINTYTPDRQSYPDISISQTGTLVTVWQSEGQDGDGYGIFCRIGLMLGSADFDEDGCVDFLDYCIFAEQWLEEQEPLTADLTDDDVINQHDLAEFCRQWLTPISR